MSRARSILLVARRELLERGRSRGFLFSMLFTTTIIIGSFVVPALFLGNAGPTKIGVVEPAPERLETAIETTAGLLDQDVQIVTYPNPAAGAAALKADEVKALVVVPADLSTQGQLTFRDEADPTL